MGFGKAKSPPKCPKEPPRKEKPQMFRLDFRPSAWNSPLLRQIAAYVERRLKPQEKLQYHARNRN
jgi:hypothetical protein